MPLPIEVRKGDTRVVNGRSFWMSATVTANTDRSVIARIRTWSREALAGFTGRAIFFFKDTTGNIIDVQPSSPYGVNGEWIPGAPSDRLDVWTGGLSEDDAVIVASIEIEFGNNGPAMEQRIRDLLRQVGRFIE